MTEQERVARALYSYIAATNRNFPIPPYEHDSNKFYARAADAAIAASQAHRAEAGLVELPRLATRKMTIAAEKLGAGEAWAEDCWLAMVEAAEKEMR